MIRVRVRVRVGFARVSTFVIAPRELESKTASRAHSVKSLPQRIQATQAVSMIIEHHLTAPSHPGQLDEQKNKLKPDFPNQEEAKCARLPAPD